MINRRRLSGRRLCETVAFELGPHRYLVSVGLFDDGEIGEIFINTNGRAGSESDVNASDAAVAVSLALQYGCPLETLREAMKRNADGSAQGPIGAALDAALGKNRREKDG